jgi:hypothetical protein
MISHENSTYEIKYTANGMSNFFKDGERVKGKTLPEGLREKLIETVDQSQIVSDDKEKNITTNKTCVFCQEYADSGKVLNAKVVPLCQEHYQTKTLGKIAQRVRELNNVSTA